MGGQEKKIDQRTRKEIITAFTVSSHHKYAGIDLMQNCDLPPPSKVFVGPDETIVFPMNRACDAVGKEGEEEQRDGRHYGTYGGENGGGDDRDKIELLKALRASQTRAREAEKKAAVLRKERDGLSVALVEEAMQLFAYRQQVGRLFTVTRDTSRKQLVGGTKITLFLKEDQAIVKCKQLKVINLKLYQRVAADIVDWMVLERLSLRNIITAPSQFPLTEFQKENVLGSQRKA
ncbi:hypothetical protein AAHE18_20G095800 [Arachis hypogaea]